MRAYWVPDISTYCLNFLALWLSSATRPALPASMLQSKRSVKLPTGKSTPPNAAPTTLYTAHTPPQHSHYTAAASPHCLHSAVETQHPSRSTSAQRRRNACPCRPPRSCNSVPTPLNTTPTPPQVPGGWTKRSWRKGGDTGVLGGRWGGGKLGGIGE